MHNAGTFFNNFDTRYRRMAIVELRHSAFERRQGDVNIVDDLLTRGKISISRTLGDGTRVDVKEGKVVRATTIKNWKRTGVYDELFCAGSALCVRQDLREDEELEGEDEEEDDEVVAEGPDEEELKAMLAAAEAEEAPPPTGFLCSISQRGRFRRLHFAGFCWRVPGVHFMQWEDLGQEEPDLAACKINARCSDCFPADRPEQRQKELEEAEDVPEDSGSESSSTAS